ncbi:MAG: acetylornithine/succinylornithine family transaminase [Coriobacteriales bacterium]|nr:acetylornithine/succinylornithine family transaminase [Coriobacteriales bacterium]
MMDLESQYMMHTYGRAPVQFVRGEGMHLWDDEGRDFLDWIAGIGVISVGHCHPKVVAAVQEQAGTLMHASNLFYTQKRGELAKKLAGLLGREQGNDAWKLFFANSGAEANEGAIKLARLWGRLHRDGATTVLCTIRSFHGRTLATLQATGQERFHKDFLPSVPGFAYVPLNDIEAFKAYIDGPDGPSVAAFMLECIQGESGVWPVEEAYLQEVAALCKERGILLICDEVQTGLYRTGKPFSFQHYGIVPDIVTIAKGVADGVPAAAFAATGPVADALKPGMHGTTFGGSLLACAAALATLEVMETEGIEANVNEVGPYLQQKLAGLPHAVETRGKGLMWGLDLDLEIAPQLVNDGIGVGLALNATGPHTLRFLPPLICSKDDVDVMIERLAALITKA